ncbi:phosphoadenylyl-sulfate reductase [Hyphococcus sp.]|uniref:phosphoadenylyl-sulfate reductase n=1 Tax=Hyphococcus sp. TaxID=2038636 RepID=UPI003CCB78D4
MANDDRELRARRLAMKHSGEDALEILRIAIKDEFLGRIALVSSFGAESAALLHLVAAIDKSTPVIFLETGKHFAQTLSYRKKLAERLGLSDVRDIRPDETSLNARDPSGDLWKRDADACCTMRKVEPLMSALGGFDAWITGRKQFHGGGRINLPAFEAAPAHIKVNPLIRWTKSDIESFYAEHDLPAHPLTAQGYPSIGCWPCTHPAASGDDIRAGRWRGAAKTECGIHGR